MSEIIFLVGLPASGKSTWADKNAEKLDAVVVSSDSIREELFGDQRIQGNPVDIFNILHQRTVDFVSQGVNVIVDRTGLSYKHRIQFLNKVSPFNNVNKKCILFATEYERCLERNRNRSLVVPEDRMESMYKSITIPQYNEGWDEIEVIWDYDEDSYTSLTTLFDELDGFEQDNKHHRFTVGEHCKKAAMSIAKNTTPCTAALLHDIGKPFCKTFTTMKGEETENAHYYGHESVSAYNALFWLNTATNVDKEKILYISGLIQYHMRPYFAKTDKAKQKLQNLVGDKMYSDLLLVHQADRSAH